MYGVSEAFVTAAEANARQIIVKAIFNGAIEITGDNIIDMTVTEAVNASGGLSMGATVSSKLVMNIKMLDEPIPLKGGYVQPYVGYYGVDEYCPLGKFYITEAVSTDDFQTSFTITAYDGFSKTETPYSPAISVPNTASAVLNDIASQCGIVVASSSVLDDTEIASFIIAPAVSEASQPAPTPDLWLDDSGTLVFSTSPRLSDNGVVVMLEEETSSTEQANFYEATCREYIGYIAGLMGRNARFNREGELEFVWYSDHDHAVPRDLQYLGGLKRLTESDFTINSITSGTSGNTFTAGNGAGISFDNPFITQEILDDIFLRVGGSSYTPANLKWRGNPAIEAGDIITAEDKTGAFKTIYVMEQTLKIGGGMYSEIKCYGDSEAAMSFSTSPTSKKLQQVYTQLQEAIKSATERLNGNNGGVFEITDGDGDGVNDGWIIRSADWQRFIKATVDGIGLTTDGGATFQQAITAYGINADVITAGEMSAQRITVGNEKLGDVFKVTLDEEGHPIIIIGSSKNNIKQKQTNDAIEFVGDSDKMLAKFSIAGAEWSDLQQMKYCGFLWTKSSATGNVRFTKVKGG